MSKINSVHSMFSPCSELGISMYRTCNSMNNLSSYCGLVDAKIRASDKDLPVTCSWRFLRSNTLEQSKLEEVIGIQKPKGKVKVEKI